MSDINEQTKRVVDELFVMFQSIFPAFKQSWPTQFELDEAKHHWLQAFILENLSDINKIKIGVQNCYRLKKVFVPSCGEFILMCKPHRHDFPSLDEAYQEACKNAHPTADKVWSHQVVYHAYRMTDSFVLSTFPRMQSYPIFERNYDLTLEMYEDGKPLKEIPIALTHNSTPNINKQVGINALQKLKDILS